MYRYDDFPLLSNEDARHFRGLYEGVDQLSLLTRRPLVYDLDGTWKTTRIHIPLQDPVRFRILTDEGDWSITRHKSVEECISDQGFIADTSKYLHTLNIEYLRHYKCLGRVGLVSMFERDLYGRYRPRLQRNQLRGVPG